MKTSSAKSKGRRASQEVRDGILSSFPLLHPDDVRVTPSGCTGEDLWFSKEAKSQFPYCVEVKNQEKLNVWASLAQAQRHADKDATRKPLLIFKKNNHSLNVVCCFKLFLDLVARKTP